LINECRKAIRRLTGKLIKDISDLLKSLNNTSYQLIAKDGIAESEATSSCNIESRAINYVRHYNHNDMIIKRKNQMMLLFLYYHEIKNV
jgi:hypothetical protein